MVLWRARLERQRLAAILPQRLGALRPTVSGAEPLPNRQIGLGFENLPRPAGHETPVRQPAVRPFAA